MFELFNRQEDRCSLILWSIEYRQFFKAHVLEFLRNSFNSHVIVWLELYIDIDQNRHTFASHLFDSRQARTQIRLFCVVKRQGCSVAVRLTKVAEESLNMRNSGRVLVFWIKLQFENVSQMK